MAFTVSSDFPHVDFIIPAAKGTGTVEVSAPAFDCFKPADQKAISDYLRENKEIEANAVEVIRYMLKHFNPGKPKHDALDALNIRQIMEINDYWEQESGLGSGKSSDSGATSNKKDS